MSNSRLQQARRQYENLLIQASDIVNDRTPLSPVSSFSSYEPHELSNPATTLSSSHRHYRPNTDHNRKNTIPNDDVIISLQEEIENLKSKLASVLASIEIRHDENLREQVSISCNSNSTKIK